MNIIAVDISEVDIICHLWEELNDYNNGLHQKYFGHELGERGEHKRQEFRSKAGEGLIKFDIVKIGDKIVGYCISSLNTLLSGEIKSIYILPKFRNRGIGTALVNEHITWLKENRSQSVFLYVHPCNTDAIRFYWKFNFFSNSPLMEICEAK